MKNHTVMGFDPIEKKDVLARGYSVLKRPGTSLLVKLYFYQQIAGLSAMEDHQPRFC